MSDADTRPLADPTPDPDVERPVLAVYVAFCDDLPDRTGESATFPDVGVARILGRCVADTDEVPVEFAPWHPVVRRAPRELDAGSMSRRLLQLTAVDDTTLYWAPTFSSSVMSMPSGGGTPVTLATVPGPGGNVNAMAVDATSLYWFHFGAAGQGGSVMKLTPK